MNLVISKLFFKETYFVKRISSPLEDIVSANVYEMLDIWYCVFSTASLCHLVITILNVRKIVVEGMVSSFLHDL